MKIQTFAIGANRNGTKKYGFKIIGVAKSKGSLTAKLTGIKEALPTAFNCFDFAKRRNKKGTTNVAPVPPMVPTKLPKPTVKTFEACSPALTN